MKLKLKLILSSMFFCSLIFAQGNSPNIQLKTDRVHISEKKKVSKVIAPEKKTTTSLTPSHSQNKIQISPPTHRHAKNRSVQQNQPKDAPKINQGIQIQEKAIQATLSHSRVATENTKTTSRKKLSLNNNRSIEKENTVLKTNKQILITENQSLLNQMKTSNTELYEAFLIDLQIVELNELKSHYNLK